MHKTELLIYRLRATMVSVPMMTSFMMPSNPLILDPTKFAATPTCIWLRCVVVECDIHGVIAAKPMAINTASTKRNFRWYEIIFSPTLSIADQCNAAPRSSGALQAPLRDHEQDDCHDDQHDTVHRMKPVAALPDNTQGELR